MNAKAIRCTTTRPCHRATCYDCRSLLTLATVDRIAADQGWDAANAYREAAFHLLNQEVTAMPARPQAPKAKAPKASAAPVSPDDVAALRKRLDSCTSRDEAQEVLRVRRMPLLRALGKSLSLGACWKYNKAELVNTLIHFSVGFRLDHNAVLNAKLS